MAKWTHNGSSVFKDGEWFCVMPWANRAEQIVQGMNLAEEPNW
jgi:hypothetical protein